jgi:hypothetical protein
VISQTNNIFRFAFGLGLLAPAFLFGYVVFEHKFLAHAELGIFGLFVFYLTAELFPLFFFAFDYPDELAIPAINCYCCAAAMIAAGVVEYALIGAVAWSLRDDCRGQWVMWGVSMAVTFLWSYALGFLVSRIHYVWPFLVPLAHVAVSVFFLILFRPKQLVG